jgi:hypothetical protein
MKHLALIFVALLISANVYAQPAFFQNETLFTKFTDDGIAASASVDREGRLFIRNLSGVAAGNLLKNEDAVAASADAGAAVFSVLESAITSSAASGDYGTLKGDTGGRLVTTNAPAGESWQGCGTATASTADVAIKAAVASNRIYVTSITCSNSSATVATNLNFKDATTVIAVGGVSQMAAGAGGSFTATFPTPLRGTSNTAFNFNTAVSVTSVICCAAGYISTI